MTTGFSLLWLETAGLWAANHPVVNRCLWIDPVKLPPSPTLPKIPRICCFHDPPSLWCTSNFNWFWGFGAQEKFECTQRKIANYWDIWASLFSPKTRLFWRPNFFAHTILLKRALFNWSKESWKSKVMELLGRASEHGGGGEHSHGCSGGKYGAGGDMVMVMQVVMW